MKSRQKEDIIAAYQTCYKILTKAGIHPILQRLDNEISDDLIQTIENNSLTYQIASPGDHRINPAEKAIQIYKDHYIAGMSGADPLLPTNQWDTYIPQANITLNLLRESRINPNISAYNQVFGNFDFNSTPLAQFGIRAVIHKRPNTRGSWANHGKNGFYVGPTLENYRNYKILVTQTKSIQISNIVTFHPHNGPHYNSSSDKLTSAIEDLAEALKYKSPKFKQSPWSTQQAVTKLQEIFNNKKTQNDNSSSIDTKLPRVVNQHTDHPGPTQHLWLSSRLKKKQSNNDKSPRVSWKEQRN